MKNPHLLTALEMGFDQEFDRPAPLFPVAGDSELLTPGLFPPESAAPEVLLERSFRELVRFYRHSCCGRLSRGIAHRMNTPLQVLSFQLELLGQKSLEELKILPEIREPAGEQLQALWRYRLQKIHQFHQELENIRGLVHNLIMQGGYEDAEERLPLNLNEVYGRELELYQADPFFRNEVKKDVHFQEGLPPVYGHYIDFSQSFRNLLENALEAMAEAPHRHLTVATSLEEGRLILHLEDTGSGIPPGIAPRIFEPFFTTKGSTKAGLGLFMVRRLLSAYGGEVRVDSVPGKSRVTMALPATPGV